MNNERNSFWDRVPLPVLIGIWLVAILAGAILVFLAFFNPTPSAGSPSAAQNTPVPGDNLAAGVQPTTAVIVPTQPPPTTAPVDTPAPVETAQPQSPAQPTIPPLQDPSLEFGIQSNALVGDPNFTMGLIKDRLLLGWVKQQVRWGDFSPAQGQMDWSGFDRVITAADAKGVRVLLSIVTAPEWSRPSASGVEGPPDDLNTYTQFIGEVIDRYKGKIHAIEVWNEQNIDAEWKTNPQAVSPERYVEMLRLAYQTIKAKAPNIIVISGALSPTGYFGGGCDARGCDDQPYLRRMTDLGFLQYADCVGVHANGINLPPDYRHDAGYNDPTARFRGPFDNPHPSWSFRSTLEDYYAITGRQKPLCVTEFGWASYEGISSTALKDYEYGLDNTAQEQADWDVQAFSLMRQWGFVKLAILFNLDFAQKSPLGAQDRTAPWSITDLQGVERPTLRAVRRFMKEVLGIP
ncbi:MAG TPA: hypothetical protein VIK33_19615 [Anaerolineae bacterium]